MTLTVTHAKVSAIADVPADEVAGKVVPEDWNDLHVVAGTPGGELGGTWGAPTVDATHSGSTHAATQAAAEATAAGALSTHAGAADPHPGYLTPAEGNAAYAPVGSGLPDWWVVDDTVGQRGVVITPPDPEFNGPIVIKGAAGSASNDTDLLYIKDESGNDVLVVTATGGFNGQEQTPGGDGFEFSASTGDHIGIGSEGGAPGNSIRMGTGGHFRVRTLDNTPVFKITDTPEVGFFDKANLTPATQQTAATLAELWDAFKAYGLLDTGSTAPAAGGGVTDADYLVGTAHAGLSNEIVVGATPGGELGGTWGSPTVDGSHSGSTHAATQAAAEATAATALGVHDADTTAVHGIADTSALYRAGGTDVAVADGGTGASTAADARTALGLVIGTDVRAQGSGDPTRASLGLATSDSPEFAGVNVGAAADTTITRSGAGDIAVEGNALYRAGGTDVPVADGGTGSSTAANARTALGIAIGTDVQAYSANLTVRTINFIIDGGGAAITTGVKGDVVMHAAGTITEWEALADQSGSIVVDIWKDTYANFPPVVADTITGAEKPTITTATKGQDTSLNSGSGWAVAAGDVLRFNVDSITTCTRVTIALKYVTA